jgi:hypothetical protein
MIRNECALSMTQSGFGVDLRVPVVLGGPQSRFPRLYELTRRDHYAGHL